MDRQTEKQIKGKHPNVEYGYIIRAFYKDEVRRKRISRLVHFGGLFFHLKDDAFIKCERMNKKLSKDEADTFQYVVREAMLRCK